jgi:hypothetical protein
MVYRYCTVISVPDETSVRRERTPIATRRDSDYRSPQVFVFRSLKQVN